MKVILIIAVFLLAGCGSDFRDRNKAESQLKTKSAGSVFDMKIGEQIKENRYYITKVPGGWMYRMVGYSRFVFVPDNREKK